MADKQQTFVPGTIVTSAWLNRLQEVMSGLAFNVSPIISGTSILLPAGPSYDGVYLSIEGQMRYVESPISVSFSTLGSGTYGVWAATPDDDTVSSFSLVASAGFGRPSGVEKARLLGSVDWDGASLTNYRSNIALPPLNSESVDPLMLSDEVLNSPQVVSSTSFVGILSRYPDPVAGPGYVRGQIIYRNDVWESIGLRTATGTLQTESGGPSNTTFSRPLIPGTKRQFRLAAQLFYSNVGVGVTSSDVQIRPSFPASAAGLTAVGVPSPLNTNHDMSIVGGWLDDADLGWGSSESVDLVSFEGKGSSVGDGDPLYHLRKLVIEMRYVRL